MHKVSQWGDVVMARVEEKHDVTNGEHLEKFSRRARAWKPLVLMMVQWLCYCYLLQNKHEQPAKRDKPFKPPRKQSTSSQPSRNPRGNERNNNNNNNNRDDNRDRDRDSRQPPRRASSASPSQRRTMKTFFAGSNRK